MPVNNRDRQVLEKIIRYCDEIEFAHDEYQRSFKRFSANPTYRNAVALCLMQIGELTGELSEEFKNENAQIPWRAIRGMLSKHKKRQITTSDLSIFFCSDVALHLH